MKRRRLRPKDGPGGQGNEEGEDTKWSIASVEAVGAVHTSFSFHSLADAQVSKLLARLLPVGCVPNPCLNGSMRWCFLVDGNAVVGSAESAVSFSSGSLGIDPSLCRSGCSGLRAMRSGQGVRPHRRASFFFLFSRSGFFVELTAESPPLHTTTIFTQVTTCSKIAGSFTYIVFYVRIELSFYPFAFLNSIMRRHDAERPGCNYFFGSIFCLQQRASHAWG